MRKERLVVPVLAVLLLCWLAGQGISSLSFERGLTRTLDDLSARGGLAVTRHAVERGWWASSGRIRLAPQLGDAWQLELGYQARHGVLSTRLTGEAAIRYGPEGKRLFGDVLPAAAPRWQASYRTLSGILEGGCAWRPSALPRRRASSASAAGSSTSAVSTAIGVSRGAWKEGGSAMARRGSMSALPCSRAATPIPRARSPSLSTIAWKWPP